MGRETVKENMSSLPYLISTNQLSVAIRTPLGPCEGSSPEPIPDLFCFPQRPPCFCLTPSALLRGGPDGLSCSRIFFSFPLRSSCTQISQPQFPFSPHRTENKRKEHDHEKSQGQRVGVWAGPEDFSGHSLFLLLDR